eukprot:TRINITY_DN2382_c0_g1_i1.p1 TRINITY_DN2382_c0_g1~~TRINITY_DN2382_c0_g1_i1.p1  ORF type:complete len:427 (+),score=150.72 TRINITY_DN2382_c0_g1_i1:64-1344(+)
MFLRRQGMVRRLIIATRIDEVQNAILRSALTKNKMTMEAYARLEKTRKLWESSEDSVNKTAFKTKTVTTRTAKDIVYTDKYLQKTTPDLLKNPEQIEDYREEQMTDEKAAADSEDSPIGVLNDPERLWFSPEELLPEYEGEDEDEEDEEEDEDRQSDADDDSEEDEEDDDNDKASEEGEGDEGGDEEEADLHREDKRCLLCGINAPPLEPMNTFLMARFVTPLGDLIPRKITGTCGGHQRKIGRVFRQMKQLGLVSYKTGFTFHDPYIPGSGFANPELYNEEDLDDLDQDSVFKGPRVGETDFASVYRRQAGFEIDELEEMENDSDHLDVKIEIEDDEFQGETIPREKLAVHDNNMPLDYQMPDDVISELENEEIEMDADNYDEEFETFEEITPTSNRGGLRRAQQAAIFSAKDSDLIPGKRGRKE